MKLEKKSLREAEEWKKAGYELPEYDLEIIQANTKKKTNLDSFWRRKYFPCIYGSCSSKNC